LGALTLTMKVLRELLRMQLEFKDVFLKGGGEKMKKLMVVLGSVILLAATVDMTQAALVDIDFDGPEYVAGELPPEPWMQEYDSTDYSIEAGDGYAATQGLVVTDDVGVAGVTYVLPTPLTSDMGAVEISILLNPPSAPSGWNFADHGGLQVGRGSKKAGTETYRGLIFRTQGGDREIYGPGFHPGTSLGLSWTPGQWYEITFEVSDDWESMTIGARPLDGEAVSDSFDWDGDEIDRIWVSSPTRQSAVSAIYDNLLITAENICPSADLTGNCFVDMADLAVMGKWWLLDCDEDNEFCEGADFNSSGEVSVEDLSVIVLEWLEGDKI